MGNGNSWWRRSRKFESQILIVVVFWYKILLNFNIATLINSVFNLNLSEICLNQNNLDK